MASPAWLQQEVQPSRPQVSIPTHAPPGAAGPPPPPLPPAPAAITQDSRGVGAGNGLAAAPEPAQAKFATAPGYAVPAPPFPYTVLANSPAASVGTNQPPVVPVMNMNTNMMKSPVVVQPPVPGLSPPVGPSFSYTVSQSGAGFASRPLQSPSTNPPSSMGQDAGVASSSSSSTSLPVTGQPPESGASAATLSTGAGPATTWMPNPLQLSLCGTLGPPGLPQTAAVSSTPTIPSALSISSPATLLRPDGAGGPVSSNPVIQQQLHSPYSSFPAMANPQGLWFQPPQMTSSGRPPYMPYPAVFPGAVPYPAHNLPISSKPSPNPQPPGVTPTGSTGTMLSSAVSSQQLAGNAASQMELHPPVNDNSKLVNDASPANKAAVNEQLDAWTSHRTESGTVYYYNALTGESTYEKPAGFKGESDDALQPAPVSTEKVAGTDWEIVTMSDGKKYYYNHKTKLSSWQIPSEVSELRKKQDGSFIKEDPVSTASSNQSSEKASSATTLSAPAVNTGGRDATVFRPSGVLASTSALDLIKKKLQDSGSPGNSSPSMAVAAASEANGQKAVEVTGRVPQADSSRDKPKDVNGDGNLSESSSESDDEDSGPTKEERIFQFKEMLKERGVAPFSKWEKELPKIVFDLRFKAIPSHSARRSLFDHYVKTRAEEERKEKRAAQKAAIEGFRKLLEEVTEDIDHTTDYYSFRKKWGHDPRFEAVERKDREILLNERVLPLKKAAEEKAQAERAAATSSFKSLLRDKGNITVHSRWSRVKDSLRDDPRYKSVKHESREALFNEYVAELKAMEEREEQETKAKREEQDKLKERERELRKRKEREEQEMERVKLKIRRKEAIESFQALLVEKMKDPQASWTESKVKLEKDPQGRASNPDLDPADVEKLFREHIKMLYERCLLDFRALLGEVITAEASTQEIDGKTVFNSWSTAKRLLKPDPRYSKMPRKDREALWHRHVEEMLRKQTLSDGKKEEDYKVLKGRSPIDSGRVHSGSGRNRDRR